MRTRHKTPTLVSMWMLDVFCCALGCVILLWVLESLSSSEQGKKAKSALTELSAAKADLLSTRDDLDKTKRKLNAEVDDLRGQLAAMLAEVKDKDAQLLKANADLSDTKKALTVSAASVESLEEEMRKKEKKATELTADLAKLRTAELNLQKLLRQQELAYQDLESVKRTADDKLTDLDAKYRALQKESVDAGAARAMAGKAEQELTLARGTIKDLKKQLDDVNANIVDLQGDKKKLADKLDRLRIDSEAKFAGIAMTGKSVVFLVDISGSMKLIDERTPDGNKWPGVIETVGKVMRSIPDLSRYQVVVFSRNAKYLLGTAGEWQAYKGEESVKAVTDALKDTVPAGDTNLHSGLDLAFKLRDQGLDTVYLFSDGLPTSGPGLTPDQERTFTDAQRSAGLIRHLRDTLKHTWNRSGDGRRVKINAVGFFYESPEVGAFLWALARENDGSFVGMSRP
jgi:predicted  nucleic acid-binding Zn-ribbon protein